MSVAHQCERAGVAEHRCTVLVGDEHGLWQRVEGAAEPDRVRTRVGDGRCGIFGCPLDESECVLDALRLIAERVGAEAGP